MAPRTRRKLVFYSGGQERSNARLHAELIALCGSRRSIRMAYVPFCGENSATYFARFERRYRAHGADEFDCICVDDPGVQRDPATAKRILSAHVVYLAGGNTFYFLHHLRRARLLGTLRRFARSGGVLAGLSAGGLLLTPHIALGGYPEFDRDENDVGLTNLRALGLVDFEFFPHYTRSPRLERALLAYSRRSGRPLYACRDGGGLVVANGRFSAHGEVALFDRGRRVTISR